MERIPNEEKRKDAADSEFAANGHAQAETEVPVEVSEETEISQLIDERDSYLDQLQRTMAEFANYRRRVEQDRVNARRIATADLLSSIVPISDDFHRALTAIPEEQREAPWVAGVTLIDRNLTNLLEREGVEEIESLGQPFDPSIHEAIAVVPGSDSSTVVEVYQNGYRHGDMLLRPAIVRVGGPIEQKGEEKDA